jgi:HK97 family phage portal protein
LAGAVGAYAQNTFRTGVPSGYLKATQPGLTPDDAEKLAERWMEKHGQARQVAVLGNTVEFVPINLSPVDAELVKMQDFSLREIAHAFGMSAHYLDVVGATGTYANVQDRAVDFRQFTLLPWARLIESELDTRLPAGTGLRLRLDGLERGTTGQRYDDYGKALAGGWLTVDEIRELEGLPPLEGGSDV